MILLAFLLHQYSYSYSRSMWDSELRFAFQVRPQRALIIIFKSMHSWSVANAWQ